MQEQLTTAGLNKDPPTNRCADLFIETHKLLQYTDSANYFFITLLE